MMSTSSSLEKQTQFSLRQHFQVVFRIALTVWAPTTIFFVGVLLLGRTANVSIGELTRDPAALMGTPYYLGLLSNIGALIWSAAASICFFWFIAIRRHSRLRKYRSFFLASGLLTTLLLVDDFFLLHEEVVPKHLGIPEKAAVAFYGLCMAFYLVVHRKLILESEYLLLGASLFFLGFSVALDVVPFAIPGKYVFEDGLKFLGIITWLLYFGRMVLKDLYKYNTNSL